MNLGSVRQTFLSAGSGDFPVARRRNTGQECPVNPQAGKPALRAGSWSQYVRKSGRPSINPRVLPASCLFSAVIARANGARTLARRKVGKRRNLDITKRRSAVLAFLRDKSRAPYPLRAWVLNTYPAPCRQSHRCKSLPARCRQHLGGAFSLSS